MFVGWGTACCALLTPAAASAAWLPAAVVGESDQTGSQISVAVNPDGVAAATWTDRRIGVGGGPGVVQHAFRPAGGAFGPATAMDPAAPDFPPGGDPPGFVRESTGNALVGVGADGASLAVWINTNTGTLWEGGSTPAGVFSRREAFAGGFAPPDDVRFLPHLRASILGGSVIAGAPGVGTVVHRSLGPGELVRFTSIDPNPKDVAVAYDTRGAVALVGWIDQANRVRVRRVETISPFRRGPIRTIAGDAAISEDGFQDIAVGLDGKSRGVVAWRRTLGGREVVRAAFLTAGARLRAPGVRTVSSPLSRAGQFDLAIAANGNATIAWTRRESAIGTTAKGAVFVARRSPAALAWSPPQRIASGNAAIAFGPPSVAMAKTVTYVGWYNDRTGTADDRMRVARRVNVGPWAQAVLGTPGHAIGALWPEVVARGSYAISGWAEASSLSAQIYKVAIYQP